MSGNIMESYSFDLKMPSALAEEPDLIRTKGYLFGVELTFQSHRYTLSVRDPFRLRQDIETELALHGYFSEKNLLVVPEVTEPEISTAVERLIERGDIVLLKAEG